MDKSLPTVLAPLGAGAIAGALLTKPEDNVFNRAIDAQRLFPRLQPPPPPPREIPNI